MMILAKDDGERSGGLGYSPFLVSENDQAITEALDRLRLRVIPFAVHPFAWAHSSHPVREFAKAEQFFGVLDGLYPWRCHAEPDGMIVWTDDHTTRLKEGGVGIALTPTGFCVVTADDSRAIQGQPRAGFPELRSVFDWIEARLPEVSLNWEPRHQSERREPRESLDPEVNRFWAEVTAWCQAVEAAAAVSPPPLRLSWKEQGRDIFCSPEEDGEIRRWMRSHTSAEVGDSIDADEGWDHFFYEILGLYIRQPRADFRRTRERAEERLGRDPSKPPPRWRREFPLPGQTFDYAGHTWAWEETLSDPRLGAIGGLCSDWNRAWLHASRQISLVLDLPVNEVMADLHPILIKRPDPELDAS